MEGRRRTSRKKDEAAGLSEKTDELMKSKQTTEHQQLQDKMNMAEKKQHKKVVRIM
jgi:hypothetical protein